MKKTSPSLNRIWKTCVLLTVAIITLNHLISKDISEVQTIDGAQRGVIKTLIDNATNALSTNSTDPGALTNITASGGAVAGAKSNRQQDISTTNLLPLTGTRAMQGIMTALGITNNGILYTTNGITVTSGGMNVGGVSIFSNSINMAATKITNAASATANGDYVVFEQWTNRASTVPSGVFPYAALPAGTATNLVGIGGLVTSFGNGIWTNDTTNLLPRDGSRAATAPLNFGNFKGTNVAVGATVGDLIVYEQLTNQSAANLTSGTLAQARQAATTAYTNQNNSFSVAETFLGNILIGSSAAIYLWGDTSGAVIDRTGANSTGIKLTAKNGDPILLTGGPITLNAASIVSNTLVVTSSINAPTNIATWILKAGVTGGQSQQNPPTLNGVRTNAGNRLIVSCGMIAASPAATDVGQGEIWTWNTGNTYTNRFGLIRATGVAGLTNANQINAWIQPGDIFSITNLSTGGGTLTVVTNNYNEMQQ